MTISLVRALAAPTALAAVLACSSTERTDPPVQDGLVPAAVLDEVAAMASKKPGSLVSGARSITRR
ncbi:MAG: hypothetical protein AAFP22_22790, partial [Planctomycetota bacterium]